MSNVDIRAAVIKAIKATLALDDNYIVQVRNFKRFRNRILHIFAYQSQKQATV